MASSFGEQELKERNKVLAEVFNKEAENAIKKLKSAKDKLNALAPFTGDVVVFQMITRDLI